MRELLRRLPPGARVLDIGSGTGKPAAADLTAAGHDVPGGWLALVTVPMDGERVPFDVLGSRVEITSFAPPALGKQVEGTGLEVVDTHVEVVQPDKAGAHAEEHLLILARRPG